MSGIVTITFSPCIDKTSNVPLLIPEKKLRCSKPTLQPGGGGINVARAIHKLGGMATAVYPAGGYTGQLFRGLMKQDEIPSIVIETEKETRENIIVLEESTNYQYRFGMPGTELRQTEWQQLLHAIEQLNNARFIVISGSLPPGVPVDIYAQIAEIARNKNAKLIVDTSGEELKHALAAGVCLVKPNLGELASLVNKNHLHSYEVAPAAREVIDEYNCGAVVVSLGQAGALLVTGESTFAVTPPPVRHRSTVGAGDSMVAGIVLSLYRNKSLEEAVQYGVACGTAATMNPGTELCKRKDADDITDLIKKPVDHTYIM